MKYLQYLLILLFFLFWTLITTQWSTQILTVRRVGHQFRYLISSVTTATVTTTTVTITTAVTTVIIYVLLPYTTTSQQLDFC